ncbi:MAG TPA: DUF2905 domain-containing protein [Candidatus Saccharimonadales bacterium]|nr:DUF2905 domain-containing protein [Candidatus Saccharimonadales bacterium]
MKEIGKLLAVTGMIITFLGLLLWAGVGKNWLGRLPGDIQYTRGNFSLHFPLMTCLIISVILTLLFWIFRR